MQQNDTARDSDGAAAGDDNANFVNWSIRHAGGGGGGGNALSRDYMAIARSLPRAPPLSTLNRNIMHVCVQYMCWPAALLIIYIYIKIVPYIIYNIRDACI